MLLNRNAILAAQDLPAETVSVPEWGGEVRVRVLTGTERDAMSAAMVGADRQLDLSTYKLRLVAASLVDEQGQRLFADAEIAMLGAKSSLALERVFVVADRLNALNLGAIEEAE